MLCCFQKKNYIKFKSYNYNDTIKKVEKYYSDKFKVDFKVIGNFIIDNDKNMLYLSDPNKMIKLNVKYKIINSFYGGKIIIYDKDCKLNSSI